MDSSNSVKSENSDLIRIIVADPHPQVRRALRRLLEESHRYDVLVEVLDWEALLLAVEEFGPDLVLMDWNFPGRPQEDPLTMLADTEAPPRVIVLSSNLDVEEEARKAGAAAFVSKADPPQKLLEALEREMAVPEGESQVPEDVTAIERKPSEEMELEPNTTAWKGTSDET